VYGAEPVPAARLGRRDRGIARRLERPDREDGQLAAGDGATEVARLAGQRRLELPDLRVGVHGRAMRDPRASVERRRADVLVTSGRDAAVRREQARARGVDVLRAEQPLGIARPAGVEQRVRTRAVGLRLLRDGMPVKRDDEERDERGAVHAAWTRAPGRFLPAVELRTHDAHPSRGAGVRPWRFRCARSFLQ
jgi:hypothetical protein